ncbi:MAG TPA: hypothetical protein VFL17_01770 [Anaerolineae bacterium]|nr:hypothetical protein [Anaerolineae bacterium]
MCEDSLLKSMRRFQHQLGMAMIYISHDMAVIAEVSDRVGVMYAGRLVELGTTDLPQRHRGAESPDGWIFLSL